LNLTSSGIEDTLVKKRISREGSSVMGMEDKLGNKAEEIKGGAKEHLGSATNDEEMEQEGKNDQTKSDFKQAGEKVKDAFKRD